MKEEWNDGYCGIVLLALMRVDGYWVKVGAWLVGWLVTGDEVRWVLELLYGLGGIVW